MYQSQRNMQIWDKSLQIYLLKVKTIHNLYTACNASIFLYGRLNRLFITQSTYAPAACLVVVFHSISTSEYRSCTYTYVIFNRSWYDCDVFMANTPKGSCSWRRESSSQWSSAMMLTTKCAKKLRNKNMATLMVAVSRCKPSWLDWSHNGCTLKGLGQSEILGNGMGFSDGGGNLC